MNERSDEEDARPERPEPAPAAPQADEPHAGEPQASELHAGEPQTSEPQAGEPQTNEPPADEPQAADATAPETAAGDRDTEIVPKPGAPPARRTMADVLSALALLVALAAAAGVGYFAWTGRGEDDAAASNRAAIDTATNDLAELQAALEDLRGRLGELDSADGEQTDRLDELADRVDELTAFAERHASIPDRLAGLEGAVSRLSGISTGARQAWLLAEAEYYLQIANAQLQLAGNPERALFALRFADERIRQVADPGLTEVRRALADELRLLQAMEMPDLAGVTMTLASLAENVESLPLQQDVQREEAESPPPEAEAGGLDRAMASVKSAFSDIISVRRTDEGVTPLLSPEAEYFLRANLALRLQTARLALLRGEQAVVEQALSDAANWLREYYAVDSRAVQSALETLAGVGEADWSVTPPDISASLRLLREYRERRRAEAPEPAPGPASGPEATADEPAQ